MVKEHQRLLTVILAVILAAILLLLTIPATAVSSSASITADTLVSTGGLSVSLPLRISGNTGICGATVSVHYDSRLVLTNVEEGSALSNLAMTKSGDLSANPIKLVWDGLEADSTNGIIATLTFDVPQADGTYDITLSYDEGDIVDGELQPVAVRTIDGQIAVGSLRTVTVSIGDSSTTLIGGKNTTGKIYAAYYDSSDTLISIKQYSAESDTITADTVSQAEYAKVMWWESSTSLKPVCKMKTIDLE